MYRAYREARSPRWVADLPRDRGEVLARRGGFEAWATGLLTYLLLVPLCIAWGPMSDRLSDRIFGGLALALLALLAGAFLWDVTGGRERLVVLVDDELWVRWPGRGFDVLPWERIERVTPIRSRQVDAVSHRFGVFSRSRVLYRYRTRQYFLVRGSNAVGNDHGVKLGELGVREPLALAHERILDELGRRFGQVEVDWWDAREHAPGTPAAARLQQRRGVAARYEYIPPHYDDGGVEEERPRRPWIEWRWSPRR